MTPTEKAECIAEIAEAYMIFKETIYSIISDKKLSDNDIIMLTKWFSKRNYYNYVAEILQTIAQTRKIQEEFSKEAKKHFEKTGETYYFPFGKPDPED